jgi:hypothetical protein
MLRSVSLLRLIRIIHSITLSSSSLALASVLYSLTQSAWFDHQPPTTTTLPPSLSSTPPSFGLQFEVGLSDQVVSPRPELLLENLLLCRDGRDLQIPEIH